MALYKCPQCSKDVSTDAQSCPHCGAKLKPGVVSKTFKYFGIFIVVFFSVLVANSILTPEYVSEAGRVREVCYKVMEISNTLANKSICDDNYKAAVQAGRNRENGTVPVPVYTQSEHELSVEQNAKDEKLKISCMENKKNISKEYKELINKKEWFKAELKVWRCSEVTNDRDYIDMYNSVKDKK